MKMLLKRNKQNKIVLVTFEGVFSSVFDSQVFDFFLHQKNKSSVFSLIVRQNLFNPFKKNRIIKLLNKIRYLDVFNFRIKYYILTSKLLNVKTIFHVRSVKPAYKILSLISKKGYKNIHLIIDIRGIPELELKFFDNQKKYNLYNKYNKCIFNNEFVSFSFVSNKLREHYETKYHQNYKNRSIICPSYSNYINLPLKNNNSKKINLVYIGGNQKYQNILSLVEIVTKSNLYTITIFTHNSIKIPDKFKSNKIKFIHGYDSLKVRKKLVNFDYGILHRDFSIFNSVATPTKVSEYWNAGLKLICIGNPCAYEEIIKKDPKLGVILELNIDTLPKLKKPKFIDKTYIKSKMKSNFSLEINANKYIEFYNKGLLRLQK